MRSRVRARLAAAVLASGAALGCPSREKTVIYDLAARAAVADLSSPREIVLFGTPAAERHLYDGFFREAPKADEGFVWARADCHLSFTWPQVAARSAVIDIEPYRGVKSQGAHVFLNGQEIGTLDLDTRRRHHIELPAAAQKPWQNLLKLVFAHTAAPKDSEPGSDDDRHLAAALYGVTIGPSGDATLMDLLGRDAPRPLAISSEGVPQLTQVGTSSVRYAVWLPRRAELRFTPDLHPTARASGGSARFRVTIEDEVGRERELWSGAVDARGAKTEEVAVDLVPGNADGIVRLGLHVAGASGDRFAWGVWKAPRVLADRGRELLDPAPYLDEERRRGEAVRDALGRPNVVFVILDAARAAQFGAYGYTRPTTPNIDAIAREGIVFENAFTPVVYTLAAMSSVWTSQHADRHQDASFGAALPRDKLTLAELLSAQGVHTAGFVANAMAGKGKGLDRGFAEFREVFKEVGSAADSFRQVLPAWLDANRDRRFFAYVHYREPHWPYDPPAPYDTQFGPDAPLSEDEKRNPDFIPDVNRGRRPFSAEQAAHLVRLYDGNLAFVDQEVGRLRGWLQERGLWDRTILVVTADHGEALGEHEGWIGHNTQLYEESIRIPLVVRLPKGAQGGRRVPGLVDLLDIAPTIADAFGVLGKGGSLERFQGRSLFPMIAGAPGKPAVLSRTLWDRPWYALRTPERKFLYHSGTGEEKLFDLTRDPQERENRVSKEPLQASYFRQTLHATIATLARKSTPAGVPATLSPEDCENMKAMGYLPADFRCGSK